MTGKLEFQYPWILALLALLPVYALWLGKSGKLAALQVSSAEIARAAGATVRAAVGRLAVFLRLLTVALGIVALAGPRFANDHTGNPGQRRRYHARRGLVLVHDGPGHGRQKRAHLPLRAQARCSKISFADVRKNGGSV